MQKWVTLLLLVALFGVAVHAIVAGTAVAPAAKSLLALSAIGAASCQLRRALIRQSARKKPSEMGDQRVAAFYLFIGLSVALISAAFVSILTTGHAAVITVVAGLCIILVAMCTALLRL